MSVDLAAWRKSRAPGWFRDIGYRFEEILNEHRYAYEQKGDRPDDPGWHACSCGRWQGYWCEFHPHIADLLRALVVDQEDGPADRKADQS